VSCSDYIVSVSTKVSAGDQHTLCRCACARARAPGNSEKKRVAKFFQFLTFHDQIFVTIIDFVSGSAGYDS